jgi:hypothetical protein
MESSSQSRFGDIGSDIAVLLITVAQLIFFVYFYQYIAWPTTGPGGSTTWLSVLNDDYFTWLPFVVAGSILVIVASLVVIIYNRDWFRQVVWIGFAIIGITVVVSLLVIFPFDFGVLPNPAAGIAPNIVTAFFAFMAVFYAATAIVLSVRFVKQMSKQETV